jgi:tRNA(Ile)-lysidine synthase
VGSSRLILPPGDAAPAWSPDHLRLHRHLLRHPRLLPPGAPLLLAVSGGQDSMALTALLADLARLHRWPLALWHGDHGWREESAEQARALAAWARGRGLPLHHERAEPPTASEAEARRWRYEQLAQQAAELGCSHVVTGHTASDRAETVLLNLARGCHRRGLASLRAQRPLHEAGGHWGTGPLLVRPLLVFSRDDTGRICRDLDLPLQLDASNLERRFARNRVRAEVMPVLEALHPGAARRIAALAQRLEEEQGQEQELLALALEGLTPAVATDANAGREEGARRLSRPGLGRLVAANRCRLLAFWLAQQGVPPLSGPQLEQLAAALAPERGPGERPLAGAWLLRWDRSTLVLHSGGSAPRPDG